MEEKLKPGESLRVCQDCGATFKVPERSQRRYCDCCLLFYVGKRKGTHSPKERR